MKWHLKVKSFWIPRNYKQIPSSIADSPFFNPVEISTIFSSLGLSHFSRIEEFMVRRTGVICYCLASEIETNSFSLVSEYPKCYIHFTIWKAAFFLSFHFTFTQFKCTLKNESFSIIHHMCHVWCTEHLFAINFHRWHFF